MLSDADTYEILKPWIEHGARTAVSYGEDYRNSLGGTFQSIGISFIPHYHDPDQPQRIYPQIRSDRVGGVVPVKILLATANYVLKYNGPSALL